MTVAEASGVLTWRPEAGQVGRDDVILRVRDGGVASAARPYRYDAKAVDPEGDALVWVLDAAPAGMSIDPSLGTIRWTPTLDQVGERDVVVRVADTQGGSASQSFTITVRAVNVPPAITSTPPTRAAAGQAYRYAVHASDLD